MRDFLWWLRPRPELDDDEIDTFQLMLDYRSTFGTPEGRRVLADLMTEFGFFEPVRNDSDANYRNVLLTILRKIGATNEGVAASIVDVLLNAQAKQHREEK